MVQHGRAAGDAPPGQEQPADHREPAAAAASGRQVRLAPRRRCTTRASTASRASPRSTKCSPARTWTTSAIKRLAENILSATARGLLPDARQVRTQPSRATTSCCPSGQATYVALILNELIQNAVEHGLKGRRGRADRGRRLAGRGQRHAWTWSTTASRCRRTSTSGRPQPRPADRREPGARQPDGRVRDQLEEAADARASRVSEVAVLAARHAATIWFRSVTNVILMAESRRTCQKTST